MEKEKTTPQTEQLMMKISSLESILTYPLPPEFSFRWYEEGDEIIWQKIQTRSDLENDITPLLFSNTFGDDVNILKSRVCFLIAPSGDVIGTATAWWNKHPKDRSGRVHWVAILPEYQGKGLGKSLVSAVCKRLSDLGHEDAYLTTSSTRKAALSVYRSLGFVQV